MKCWLVKTEPEAYSIDDMARDRKTLWTQVRNYQARNYLKEMAVGEQVLFYHSNAEPTGIVGLVEVGKTVVADPSQFEARGEHFDSKATLAEPRWFAPELRFVERFARVVTLSELKVQAGLEAMVLLQRGSRLSVQPVTAREMKIILGLAELETGTKKRAHA